MHGYLAAFAFFGALGCVPAAALADADSPPATLSCDQSLALERDPQDTRVERLFEWIQETLAVFNSLAPPEDRLDVSGAELEAYLSRYCVLHPEDSVVNAILYYLLEGRQRPVPLEVMGPQARTLAGRPLTTVQ